MKKLIHIGFMLCAVLSAAAQETSGNQTPAQKVLRVYDWKDLMSQHPFPNCQIVSMDGESVLKIENTNSIPANYDLKYPPDFPPSHLDTNNTSLQMSLLEITNSLLIEKTHSISFEMKYENLLIKWVSLTNQFGGTIGWSTKSADVTLFNYFSPPVPGGDKITNGTTFMGGMVGSSNWKPYQIFVSRRSGVPEKLELTLFLPGHGTVYLRPLKLIGIKSDWWSPQMGGMIGGTAGALLGCLGGLLGCLAAMGKARGFVLAMTKVLIALGMLTAFAGLVAVASSQPYAVWYPLVLIGGILIFVFLVNLYPIKKRYDDLEIRRMTSMDATGR